jgi:hypothetical protein
MCYLSISDALRLYSPFDYVPLISEFGEACGICGDASDGDYLVALFCDEFDKISDHVGKIELNAYPIVSVNRSGRRLKVNQTRFVFSNVQNPLQTWAIPFGIKELTSVSRMQYWLVERRTEDLPLNNDECQIIANSNGTGYYRVACAPSLLGELSTIAPKLSEEDRFTSITDCWATVQLGYGQAAIGFNLGSL